MHYVVMFKTANQKEINKKHKNVIKNESAVYYENNVYSIVTT